MEIRGTTENIYQTLYKPDYSEYLQDKKQEDASPQNAMPDFPDSYGRAQVMGINTVSKFNKAERKDYTSAFMKEIERNEEYAEIYNDLIEEGYDKEASMRVAVSCITDEEGELFLSLQDGEFVKTLQKSLNNPQMNGYIEKLFDTENMHPVVLRQIIRAGESKEGLLKLGKEFFKSPFKLAMKTPQQYLDGIPASYTTKRDGKYPPLEEKTKEKYEKETFKFFEEHFGESLKLLKYTDTDTFNQLMDRRLCDFGDFMLMFDTLSEESLELIRKGINCKQQNGKPLTARDKISIINIISGLQYSGIKSEKIEEMFESGTLDKNELYKAIREKALEVNGISAKEAAYIPEDKLDFDRVFVYELLCAPGRDLFNDLMVNFILPARKGDDISDELKEAEDFISGESDHYRDMTKEEAKITADILKNYDTYSAEEIKEKFKPVASVGSGEERAEVIQEAARGDFSRYTERLPQNQITKRKFEENGLDYNKWRFMKPEKELEINGKQLKMSLWERRPQKDLFTGNRTSCCTALSATNGGSMPSYLLNTCFNVVQLTDKNGDIVAMSRIFAAKRTGSP